MERGGGGARRAAGMECGGIADGSCPRTGVLKRRSHGIAGAGGKAGKRCKHRREKKGNKYLHTAAQPCFGNVFLQVSSLLSWVGEIPYSVRFGLRFL